MEGGASSSVIRIQERNRQSSYVGSFEGLKTLEVIAGGLMVFALRFQTSQQGLERLKFAGGRFMIFSNPEFHMIF